MNAVYLENSKLTQNQLEADFVVIGGGMAGICASIAAARNGARVILIQDRSILGGNASNEIRMHIVGADIHGWRPGARESGIIEELRLEDAVRNPQRSYSQWDLLLYEKVVAEPNITLMLNSSCVGCEKDSTSGAIRSVTVLRNSTEDLFEISASFFADCSGDSRLGWEADAACRVGRESRDEYREPLAPETADAQTLGSSILISARKYDSPQSFKAPAWARKFTKADLIHRPIESYEYGYWWFEWGGQLDTIKDNEIIRHELLRIALGIWNYVKNSGDHPASANWALDWVGPIPGKRESRRLLGSHVLTQEDVQSGRIFTDAVAYGGWPIDLHPPTGVDAVNEKPFNHHDVKYLYTIPLRSLISRNVPNLLFAGRNISATHVAFASTRVMATCSVMGQAIGTAAALASKHKIALEKLGDKDTMRALQECLLRDDAFIPGIKAEDPQNKAGLFREITASSSKKDCPPTLVFDGLSRDLAGNFGPWDDSRPHHWESENLPASIQLLARESVEIREIHLTFDTGFQRELMLSLSNHASRKVIRGPQPETVKAYRIFAGETCLVDEQENYQRKRIHRLVTPVRATSLKIEVLSTHGLPCARIFEVRVY